MDKITSYIIVIEYEETGNDETSSLSLNITKMNKVSELFFTIITEKQERTFRDTYIDEESTELFAVEKKKPSSFGLKLTDASEANKTKLQPGDIFIHSVGSLIRRGKFKFGIAKYDESSTTDCKCHAFAKLSEEDCSLESGDKIIDTKVLVHLP